MAAVMVISFNMEDGEIDVEDISSSVRRLHDEISSLKADLSFAQEKLNDYQRLYDEANIRNDGLQQQVERLQKELKCHKSLPVSTKDVAIQNEDHEQEQPTSEASDEPVLNNSYWSQAIGETVSIAESLKATAEAAVLQSGYVYDENSGLYYDYNTGCYYDSERALYYDPRTGAYYTYDQSGQTYLFHSQVQLPSYSTVSESTYSHHQRDAESRNPVTAKKTKSVHSDEGDRRKEKRKIDEARLTAHETSSGQNGKLKTVKWKNDFRKHKRRLKSIENNDIVKSELDAVTSKCVDIDFDRNGTSKKKCDTISTAHETSSGQDGKLTTAKRKKDIRKHKRRLKSMENKDVIKSELDSAASDDVDVGDDRNSACKNKDSSISEVLASELQDTSNSDSERESLEEGECSSTTDSSSDDSDWNRIETISDGALSEEDTEMAEDADELSSQWPPCIRVIVKMAETVPLGTLFIITCTGANIGREKSCLVTIPELGISKVHAEVTFHEESGQYVVKDCGSQNGTFLNDHRLSEAKTVSETLPLTHGDVLRLGENVVLLLHIHQSTETCNECEPGQVQAEVAKQRNPVKDIVVLSTADKDRLRRLQLKQIKKRYGLKDAAYVDDTPAISKLGYKDKAEERRKEKGSDNPHKIDEAPSSVDRHLSTENKGFKLLKGMGWKEGESLGKGNVGITEPVNVAMRTGTGGLGSKASVKLSLDNVRSKSKAENWARARARFEKLTGVEPDGADGTPSGAPKSEHLVDKKDVATFAGKGDSSAVAGKLDVSGNFS